MDPAVVEMHHEVLIPWSEYRRSSGGPSPVVLVLDHHTDVLPAFRDPFRPVEPDAWRDPAVVRAAVAGLHHDEHFDWAVRSGLVSRCIISSHVNATPVSDPGLEVRCDSRWRDENHVFADPEQYRTLADSVLESDYLIRIFGKTLPDCFFLDIDCDYFSTWNAFHPKDHAFFTEMVRKARLITVSLERDWVRLLRFTGETFTAPDIVRELFPGH